MTKNQQNNLNNKEALYEPNRLLVHHLNQQNLNKSSTGKKAKLPNRELLTVLAKALSSLQKLLQAMQNYFSFYMKKSRGSSAYVSEKIRLLQEIQISNFIVDEIKNSSASLLADYDDHQFINRFFALSIRFLDTEYLTNYKFMEEELESMIKEFESFLTYYSDKIPIAPNQETAKKNPNIIQLDDFINSKTNRGQQQRNNSQNNLIHNSHFSTKESSNNPYRIDNKALKEYINSSKKRGSSKSNRVESGSWNAGSSEKLKENSSKKVFITNQNKRSNKGLVNVKVNK